MMIPLFDLHCDTFLELYKQNKCFYNSSLHISLDKVNKYVPYIQVSAIWSDYRLSNDEAYQNFYNCLAYINSQGLFDSKMIYPHFILAIEDGRILNGDYSRLTKLYENGVKLITLNWYGDNCLGGGWNTNNSLTAFGKSIIEKCAKLNIIIDLSHSSLETQKDALNLAFRLGISPIFSHSNSFSVCPHKRNLKDEIFLKIVEMGGLVGISLAPQHLEIDGNANMDSIIKHIDYYLNLGGENIVCLGCDFDGVTSLPKDMNNVRDLEKLFQKASTYFGDKIARKIFFGNAYKYFRRVKLL